MDAWRLVVIAIDSRRAFSIPGIRTHYVLRKKIIEREVRQAIAAGCRQVVVLGAGFDVMSFRLVAEFPSVRFIELDHPATQNAKRGVAERYGSNIEFIAEDLRNAPMDVPVDREKETVFIVEGVLMYFSEQQSSHTAIDSPCCEKRAPDLHSDGERSLRRSTWLANWWLKRRGEPFRWALVPDAVRGFLAPVGLDALRVYGAREIRAELPAGAPAARCSRRIYRGRCMVSEPITAATDFVLAAITAFWAIRVFRASEHARRGSSPWRYQRPHCRRCSAVCITRSPTKRCGKRRHCPLVSSVFSSDHRSPSLFFCLQSQDSFASFSSFNCVCTRQPPYSATISGW